MSPYHGLAGSASCTIASSGLRRLHEAGGGWVPKMKRAMSGRWGGVGGMVVV
jgi:hypothetical protein